MGGGKGMRVAYNDKECVEYFDLCKEEAISAFNNGKMLVEKFIENPRHIEVQVIADRCGNTLYLPERECSIQRRNQKVIEEAPSSFIDPATRKHMGEQAAAMARKVQYVTAGTVEMVVDQKRNFYFLEMNTRLQVEHPITELITGVDLVEQMLLAAAGKPLSIKQEDIKINGWATETRVYAEDPMKNFFPSIGRLLQYEEPKGEGVRVDSGIVEGSQISVYYDPLIAKLCTWGPTRDKCLERMRGALDEYVIRGLRHNVCLLRDIIDQERYIKGAITTNYIKEVYPNGFVKANIDTNQEKRLNAVSAIMHAMRMSAATSKGAISTTVVTCMKDKRDEQLEIFVEEKASTAPKERVFEVSLKGGEKATMKVHWEVDFPVFRVITEGFGAKNLYEAYQFFGTNELTYDVQYYGTIFHLNAMSVAQAKVLCHMPEEAAGKADKFLRAPMPGVIVAIAVQPGQKVVAGTELLTLEAMKMRNKIRAEQDGVVKKMPIKVGGAVEDGAVLVEFE